MPNKKETKVLKYTLTRFKGEIISEVLLKENKGGSELHLKNNEVVISIVSLPWSYKKSLGMNYSADDWLFNIKLTTVGIVVRDEHSKIYI